MASLDLPVPTYLSFTARTGGDTNNHWVRNVRISEPLCQAGQYLSNEGRCLQCNPGQYQVAGHRSLTTCISCPAGKHGTSDRVTCLACEGGYTSVLGASSSFDCERRPNSFMELTAKAAYDIDIESIPAGSAARSTFETEFTAAVAIAMGVRFQDVVINSITSVSPAYESISF